MDAIELLKQQHDEVKKLFEECKAAGDDVDTKLDLFTQIADLFAAHATIEEKLFYPSVYIGPTASQLREAVEEHLAAKRVIADLLDLDSSDEQFDAKLAVLEELINHHVQEEEKDLFIRVKKLLTREELEVMAEELKALFEEVMQGEPHRELPGQTGAAPPLA